MDRATTCCLLRFWSIREVGHANWTPNIGQYPELLRRLSSSPLKQQLLLLPSDSFFREDGRFSSVTTDRDANQCEPHLCFLSR
jgi:hypothetical protein